MLDKFFLHHLNYFQFMSMRVVFKSTST